ncbi:MAG: DUF302 domain-containing protein [Rhodothermales bacterium]
MPESIGFEISLTASYDEALQHVTDELKKEGFGVLSRIDIHAAFKEKLDVDFRPYTILGACNPPLAHRALTTVPEVGLLLPCNVTVEATADGGALVRIVNPNTMMTVGNLGDDEVISGVGAEAYERLMRVAASLRA